MDQLTMFQTQDLPLFSGTAPRVTVEPYRKEEPMPTQLSMFAPAPTKPSTRPTKAPKSVKGCHLIYQPKGRAREYAALACNVYSGCDHKCIYCYGPSVRRMSPDQFGESSRRSSFLRKLEREAAKYEAAGVRGQVHLCFTCDPYQHLDEKEQVTRRAIEILHRHGLNVAILTKGGSRALRDLDLFVDGDAFASTLTLLDPDRSLEWEPNAALPQDRIDTIRAFHDAGVPTWVSLEPVIDPDASLEIIQQTHEFVDVFKVGKMNYHPIAKEIDWAAFARDAIQLLSDLGYARITDPDEAVEGQADHRLFYIKDDLAAYL